jgi:hypothetical protein
VNVDEPVVGNDRRDRGAKQLARASTAQCVDTMNDDGLGIREALREDVGKEQVLGGARATTLAQHPLDGAVARTSVGQRSHGFDQIDQRGVQGVESGDHAGGSDVFVTTQT